MSESQRHKTNSAFRKFAWAFLGYLLLVILFGAWVRITHSGAGCGEHWPTCHGEIVPFEPTTETIIEYTHRLTSGLLGILGVILVIWARAAFPRRRRVFWSAVVTMFFIVVEALIGAGLVLNSLVESDDSVARAVVISLHLINTLMLTGSAALTAWWSSGGSPPGFGGKQSHRWLLTLGLAVLVVTSMTGAITALGDTLFPVDPTVGEGFLQNVRDDLSPANHFLVRLRILHPVIAVLGAVFITVVMIIIRTSDAKPIARKLALGVLVLVGVEVAAGAINIWLGAPGWLQLVHLALAQAVWVALLLTAVEALAVGGSAAGGEERESEAMDGERGAASN